LQCTPFNGINRGGGIRCNDNMCIINVVEITTIYEPPTLYRRRFRPPSIAILC